MLPRLRMWAAVAMFDASDSASELGEVVGPCQVGEVAGSVNSRIWDLSYIDMAMVAWQSLGPGALPLSHRFGAVAR